MIEKLLTSKNPQSVINHNARTKFECNPIFHLAFHNFFIFQSTQNPKRITIINNNHHKRSTPISLTHNIQKGLQSLALVVEFYTI
ncbi:hypothetical protein L2E82_12041 [Cichorium intybus]|uniref:Uncharacterized protein n=1 Tax=Cichorium intybus TaxID=13427 RepID=A0ACB9GEZ8_CICIN|nr:hypothetical protein L2E82_12041 [Cichorium intybus]